MDTISSEILHKFCVQNVFCTCPFAIRVSCLNGSYKLVYFWEKYILIIIGLPDSFRSARAIWYCKSWVFFRWWWITLFIAKHMMLIITQPLFNKSSHHDWGICFETSWFLMFFVHYYWCNTYLNTFHDYLLKKKSELFSNAVLDAMVKEMFCDSMFGRLLTQTVDNGIQPCLCLRQLNLRAGKVLKEGHNCLS